MRLSSLVLASAALFSQAALAVVALPSVSIDEYPRDGVFDPYYVVHNNSASAISYFAVSNPKQGNVRADRAGWRAISLPAAGWDNPAFMLGFNCSQVGETWSCANESAIASVFGSFASNFGTAKVANLYWAANGNPIAAGETSEHFSFGGPIASDFVTWNAQGATVASGQATPITASVPEPATAALLLAGLAAVGAGARRRLAR